MGGFLFAILFLWVIGIPVAIAIAIINSKKVKNQSTNFNWNYNIQTQQENTNTSNYSKKYQRKYLLTKNEWHEYKKLKVIAENKGLQICPKVRLLDIIEPRKGERDYMALLGKIQSKHVDFVICDQNMYVKAILELDDNSHNQKNRKERDAFVDQILTSVGYKVIHVRSITETTLDDLEVPERAETNIT